MGDEAAAGPEIKLDAEKSQGASVEVEAGVCGYTTSVSARKTQGYNVSVAITSECPHVSAIGSEVAEVDALRQIGLRGGLPTVLETAYRHCVHAACPVPSALVKAIEVAAGLALPRDVSMRISND
jgi:hypothetical protein